MKVTHLVARKQKAYIKAIQKRAQVNHSAGKVPKNYNKVQERKLSIKVNKNEVFEKKLNHDKKLFGKLVSSTKYVKINDGKNGIGTLANIHSKIHTTKKERRNLRRSSV